MVKQLSSGSETEKQSNKQSLVVDAKERTALIGEYLYKYGAIANRNIDAELIGIYVEALKDVPLNRLKSGLVEWLEEGEIFPWPSQIREASEL